jgi:tetratricopeptide (TPR) repeat protein
VVFLSVVLGVVFIGAAVLRAAYIDFLAESTDQRTLEKALALEPPSPEIHHRLGIILTDSLTEVDRAEGLKQLRRATELNPYQARYWSDLAWVCELGDDMICATHAVKQAVTLSPMTPQLHWVAGNTLLRAGQNDAALAEFHRLLELDPAYAPATFHLCLGSLGNPQLILQKVVPKGNGPEIKLEYLNFLTTNELGDQAQQVWQQVVADGTRFPLSAATPYIDHLLEIGQVDEARSAWGDLEKLGVVRAPETDNKSNLVFNGNFEQIPLNTGFDWRYSAGQNIALDFSDPTPQSGKSCLRIEFPVSRNDQFVPVFQYVPVAQNQAYLLSAFVRSQDITSDSGPRLLVQDPAHASVPNVVSETTVGSTPWHQIRLSFCTGAVTKLVQISVVRIRGRTFPTEISGSFWLDSVVLKSTGPASTGACSSPSQ